MSLGWSAKALRREKRTCTADHHSIRATSSIQAERTSFPGNAPVDLSLSITISVAKNAVSYQAPKHVSLLAGRRSGIVAVIVPNIASSTFSGTEQALSDDLLPQELELLLAATDCDPDRGEQQIRAVLAWCWTACSGARTASRCLSNVLTVRKSRT